MKKGDRVRFKEHSRVHIPPVEYEIVRVTGEDGVPFQAVIAPPLRPANSPPHYTNEGGSFTVRCNDIEVVETDA